MEWYIECLIGIVLGIYVASRKVREVINFYVFRRNRQPDYEELIRDAEEEAAPIELTVNKNGQVEVSVEQLSELLKQNPNLKVSAKK